MRSRIVAEPAGTFGPAFFGAGAVMIEALSGGMITHARSAIASSSPDRRSNLVGIGVK